MRQVTKYLTLGVDSPLRNKVTTTANRITSPHVELVCVVDLGSEPFRLHWTGKSYPTNSQADRLVRITDLTSHFTKLGPIGEVLILGCHDLTMFNPRARANAQEWRQHTWKSFEVIAKDRKPVAVLASVPGRFRAGRAPVFLRRLSVLRQSLGWVRGNSQGVALLATQNGGTHHRSLSNAA
jgi:hypothetical protein